MDEEYGEECRNCECLVCIKNDACICDNCDKCNGNKGYSKWKIYCKQYIECVNPEETIIDILGEMESN